MGTVASSAPHGGSFDPRGHQTSSLTSRLILAYVEREAGAEAVEEVLRRSGLTALRDELRSESAWFSFETKIALFEAAAEVLGDGSVAEHIGRSASELSVFSGFKAALRTVGATRLAYSSLPRHARKFTWAHRLELERISSREARFRYVDVSGAGYHPSDCRYNAGMLACVPTMFGALPAQVRHVECGVRGADACVYEVRWSEPGSRGTQIAARWGLAASAAAAAARLGGRGGRRAALGVGALGSAHVAVEVFRERSQKIASLKATVRDQRELGERLFASLRDLVSALRVEEVLAKIVANAQGAVTGREFVLLVAGPGGTTSRGASNVPDASVRTLEAWAAAHPEALDVARTYENLREVPELAALASHGHTPLGAMATLPLRFRGESFGALVALAHGADRFDRLEVAVLEAYADQAAIALGNARLFAKVEEMARRDALTGLLNSREFDADLSRALTRAERYDEQVSVALVDLDGFKLVNDRLGHAEGDRVLTLVARALADCHGGRGEAYRIGGDEFALVLPGLDRAEADAVTAGLTARVEELACGVAASCGVAVWPEDGPEHATLVFNADRALYAAKEQRTAPAARRAGRTILTPVSGGLDAPAGPAAAARSMRAVTTALARAVDARDLYTRNHSETVSELTESIARTLGLPAERVADLALAGLLHDIGKIGVPDAILYKPGPLTDEEYEAMKSHSTVGHAILAGAELGELAEWVLHHHERPDGRGYPHGLAGDEIPLESRIMLVADAFEALTSDRPYRRGRPVMDALAEIERHRGTQFDPACVDALRVVLGSGSREIFGGGTPWGARAA